MSDNGSRTRNLKKQEREKEKELEKDKELEKEKGVEKEKEPELKSDNSTSSQKQTRSFEGSTEYAVHQTQILDPMSAIINLAILSYKPVNTKISIAHNCIHIQETGIFQAFVRYMFRDNKYFLNLLYNPIELAGEYFLNKDRLNTTPKIKQLFERALLGIEQLRITYADDNVIHLCLNYYMSLIQNYLGNKYDDKLFKPDLMTPHYKKELIQKLNDRWSPEKLKVISEMNEYLMKGSDTSDATNGQVKYDNVKCMEIFMRDVDEETHRIIYTV